LDWTEVAKTVGSTGVVLVVIGYFLRAVFGQVLSRDLEKFKADLSAKHDIEIERLRNDLRIAASERETRFIRLHETRAETIAELYKRLVRAHWAFEAYLNLPKDSPVKPEDAEKCAREFASYFNDKRIYFEEEVCRNIDEAIQKFVKVYVWTGAYPQEMTDSKAKWAEAAERFNRYSPSIRARIERQFRELIGVKEAQSNGQRTTDKGLLPQ
jgi:hypothetical protein